MASDVGGLVTAARRWPSGGSGRVEPLASEWSWSHSLFVGDLEDRPVIVKVFGDGDREEHLRDWDALRALAGEGLAPAPVHLGQLQVADRATGGQGRPGASVDRDELNP